jgi:hypothetical protein
MPPIVVARMLGNLAADAAIGAVPLLGDLGDLAFRANLRNVDLLASRTAAGGRASWRDWAAVGGAALALVAAVGLAGWAAVAFVRWIL